MSIFRIFHKNTKKDADLLREKVDGEFIDSAYSRRVSDIESLKKYDRGEKTITPANLKKLTECI